ncbi:hypothetical protein [Pseudonocardia acidicola]|uniref:hypothetical protein n=1 Tax=Pseudonocardia acidicola TaxID=2724939 RepID=UPI001EEFB217|nr:hypothetical protein [Pseudonocardia acidicola]
MTRRVMSAQDSLWLRLDRPQNVLAVVSVMWTQELVPPGARFLITWSGVAEGAAKGAADAGVHEVFEPAARSRSSSGTG